MPRWRKTWLAVPPRYESVRSDRPAPLERETDHAGTKIAVARTIRIILRPDRSSTIGRASSPTASVPQQVLKEATSSRESDRMIDPVYVAAQNLAVTLQRVQRRIVFAESCTAGLVSATLGRIPGISQWLCGSAVVYRLDTKHRWLGVSQADLIQPGPVSPQVAEAMARGVLERTPEADLAVAVTGHLGPDAPLEQDGLVYLAGLLRERSGLPAIKELRLPTSPENSFSLRESRQRWAAAEVLQLAQHMLSDWENPNA